MATRNNTTAIIRVAVAIGLLLYLPFWFNKRFPSTPEPDQYKLGGEAGVPLRTPDSTRVATPVEDMELPESADSIGMKFKLIPAGTFTMGDANGVVDLNLHAVASTRT